MSLGPLVVELLTRAHRAGYVLQYLERPTPRLRVVNAPCRLTDDQRAIELDFHRYRPDVLEVLARSCTVRTCTAQTWIREYGTDLPWCRPHAGTRGLQLLREERPDLFPTITKETAA